MTPNQALWEKGDFTRIAATMRDSGQDLIEAIGVQPGDQVLDLGCGDGTTALPAAQRGAKVLGVDIARNLVEAGRQRAAQAGRADLPYPRQQQPRMQGPARPQDRVHLHRRKAGVGAPTRTDRQRVRVEHQRTGRRQLRIDPGRLRQRRGQCRIQRQARLGQGPDRLRIVPGQDWAQDTAAGPGRFLRRPTAIQYRNTPAATTHLDCAEHADDAGADDDQVPRR